VNQVNAEGDEKSSVLNKRAALHEKTSCNAELSFAFYCQLPDCKVFMIPNLAGSGNSSQLAITAFELWFDFGAQQP
jgi:hypothetical protein